MLEQMLQPQTTIKGISAITEQEKNTLLFEFNNTAIDYPKDKCVHQLFEEQVEKTPDKIAVIACDRTLTYRELNEQANRIAHSLIGRRVKLGDIVALILPRRSYLIASMYGVLKAGGAYLPIDPDYPQERIQFLIEESAAKLCISKENVSTYLNGSNNHNPDLTITEVSTIL